MSFPSEPCKLHFLLESLSEPSVSDPPKVLSSADARSLYKSSCASTKERSWKLAVWSPQHLPCAHRKPGVLALGAGGFVLTALSDTEVPDHAMCQHFRNVRILVKLS